jgi:hypothetical protein
MDLRHALQIIDGGEWLSIAYVKADKKKGEAGEIVRLKKARIARHHTDREVALQQSKAEVEPGTKKNPNHSEHFTRNFQLANQQIRKAHALLIFEINGQPVI